MPTVGRPLSASRTRLTWKARICIWTVRLFVGITVSTGACQGASLDLRDLRCEYRVDPLGIDTPSPRLSWVLESRSRGQSQTAYQILAATSSAQLFKDQGDLWDSGKVASSSSVHVVYGGKGLASGQRVYWKVRAWDADGKPSLYSRPACWEMALLQPSDWQARWIQRKTSGAVSEADAFDDHPAPLFRKEFALDKKIVRARACVSGLGYYELHLNGQRVGDHDLDPGWTTYSKRVLYSTYDVTRQLQRGRNALGIMLGNGWYNPLPLGLWGRIKVGGVLVTGEPCAVVQLRIEFTDGKEQTIATDESWRAGDGPVLRNSVYLGEVYDARREQNGWDQVGFNDSHWTPAIVVRDLKLGPLQAQEAPPIRITRTFKPVKLTEPKPGVYIFDFGQNFAGWARLRVSGEAGTRVRLRSGELLYTNGILNGMTAVCGQLKAGGENYRYPGSGVPQTAFQLDEYVLKGQGVEVFTPRFTFHGFRYVEVTGFPGRPTLEALEGLGLNSDVETAGSFECSNELLNRIQRMVRSTLLANLFSVQSDCPHREKLAYGGDIAASSEMAMLNFDMSRFYAKAERDLADAARPYGALTETAPFVGISDQSLGDVTHPVNLGEQSGPIDYGVAHPLLALQLHQYYGDRRLLEEEYTTSKRWVELLRSKAVDNLLDNGISDHESLLPKPRALTGTAFYYYNVKLLAQLARILGKEADAADAEAAATAIKTAFNLKFLRTGTGKYDATTQACQAFALYMGLVPPEETDRALEVLVRDITGTQKGHLTTGIFGTKYMLNVLTDSGRADVAYQFVNQRTFPGWGWMLESGATTLWEHWEFSDDTYSHNHPMFGSVSEWFYKALAGIRPAPDAVGFDKIIIQPQPVGDLKWVRASYNSVRGKIVSEWQRQAGHFELHLLVPVGSSATLVLPAQDRPRITESGKPLERAPGVQFLRMEDGKAILALGSGEYRFVSFLR
jgi:alpha-L-rhamnosidase